MRIGELQEAWKGGLGRLAVLSVVSVAPWWLGETQASAATLNVCPHGCAYAQIGDVVDAAVAGDRVSVAGGVYDGGFTIDKDLT